MHYIYRIIGKKDNRQYIGRTSNPEKREYTHFLQLRNNTHHCMFLQRAFNKYGENNYEFELIEKVDTFEEAIKRELYYLETEDNLYNVSKNSSGGDLISYHPNKEEIVRKITKSLRDRYANMTDKEKEIISQKLSGKNNPNYGNKGEKNPMFGVKKSKEHCLKISQSLKGRKISRSSIEKIRKAKLGKTPWNKGMKLKPLTDEVKQKISISLKDKNYEYEWKPVVCESIFFPSIKHASECYRVSQTTIINRVKSNKEKWKHFFYFDNSLHTVSDFDKYDDYSQDKISKKLTGDNRGRKVYCEGTVFNSLKEAIKHYGFNSINAIVYRIESKAEKWKDFYYVD